MKRTPRTALIPLALAVAVGVPSGAAAAEDCYGFNTLRVCVTNDPGDPPWVDPDGGPTIQECVYVGASCIPVSVTLPSAGTGGGGSTVVTCYRGEPPEQVRCW